MRPGGWRRFFRNPFARGRLETEIREEFVFHLEERTRELVASGMGMEEARVEARRQFGDVERWVGGSLRQRRAAERTRDRRELGVGVLDDLRAGVRHLARRPQGPMVAVLVLAGAIAVAAPTLSILEATLFRPPPFPEPDRVVRVHGTVPEGPVAGTTFQVPGGTYLDWASAQRSFESMAATQWADVTLGRERPEQLRALRVEASFFDVIGTPPALGRPISPEATAGGVVEVVLTDGLWRSRFGADPAVVGRNITLSGAPAVIVGVMPPHFRYSDFYGLERTPSLLVSDPFVGWGGDPALRAQGGRLQPIARLAPGRTLEEVRADMASLTATLAEEQPEVYRENGGLYISVLPFLQRARERTRTGVLVIAGAVALLLLLSAGNAGAVFLASVSDRHRELIVRAALGAPRARLMRQIFLESGLLIAVACLLGAGLAVGILSEVKTLVPGVVPGLESAAFRAPVVAGFAIVVVGIWLVTALAPVVRGTRFDLRGALNGSGPRTTRSRASALFLGGELAITTLLAASAGVLIQNQHRVLTADPGFDAEGLAVIRVTVPEDGYSTPVVDSVVTRGVDGVGEFRGTELGSMWRIDEEFLRFKDDVLAEMTSIPGVQGAVFVNNPPLWGTDWVWGTGLVPGTEGERFAEKWVDADYFELMGIDAVAGRLLEPGDVRGTEPVVVVTRTFVEVILDRDPDPVGRRITYFGVTGDIDVTIVGVVDDVVQDPRLGPGEILYQPLAQRHPLWTGGTDGFARQASFIVRSSLSPTELLPRMREALWRVDPELPVEVSTTLEARAAELGAEGRFYMTLVAVFAFVTLVLSLAGTGALFLRRVQARSREIGIRRALGSTATGVRRLVLTEAGVIALCGGALGLAGSFSVDRVFDALILGYSGEAMALRLGAAVLIPLVVLAVAMVPARRAARVDPMEILRAQ